MDEITKIETIDQYDQLFGLETLHPLVNVIDFSKATKTVEYYHMNIGFYSLFLKDINCGDLKYGRNYYDYQEGTVVCMAPGQVIGIDNRKKTPQRTKSIGVLFHPDLIRGTSLGQNIKNYSFFSYEVNEALHLSEQEKEIVTDCIHKIQIELEHAIDKHTKQIVTSTIETMLNRTADLCSDIALGEKFDITQFHGMPVDQRIHQLSVAVYLDFQGIIGMVFSQGQKRFVLYVSYCVAKVTDIGIGL